MSKKDKKIEIQLADSQVKVGNEQYEGYILSIGKKVIGQIAEFDGQFAIIKMKMLIVFIKNLKMQWKN